MDSNLARISGHDKRVFLESVSDNASSTCGHEETDRDKKDDAMSFIMEAKGLYDRARRVLLMAKGRRSLEHPHVGNAKPVAGTEHVKSDKRGRIERRPRMFMTSGCCRGMQRMRCKDDVGKRGAMVHLENK